MAFLAPAAHWGSSANPLLLALVFDSLSTGFQAAPTGLAYTRASAATAQTSASSLATSGSNDTFAVYGDGTRTGWQFEEARSNYNTLATNFAGYTTQNSGASAPTLTGTQADPASGTSATQFVMPAVSGTQYSDVYTSLTTMPAGSCVISRWFKGNSGGENTYLNLYLGGTYSATRLTLTNAWARYSAVASPQGVNDYVGTNMNISGEVATAAATWFVYGAQVESGKFATSLILSSGSLTTRAAGRGQIAQSSVVNAGRIELYVKLWPLGGLSAYSGNVRILTLSASYYVELNVSTGVITVTDGTNTATSTALSFSALDTVELKIQFGNAATNILANVNGGGTQTLLSGGTAMASITASGNLDLLSNTTTQTFSSIVARAKFYTALGTPAGWSL